MWQCEQCKKQYKYRSEKTRHEASHIRKYECVVCKKQFGFLSALKRHRKQHERKELVECGKCGHKFKDKELLKRHLNYAHAGDFICMHCKSIFNSSTALQTHMKIHGLDRAYSCSFEGCMKSFNFPHHLKNHLLTHTNSKQYFCEYCQKGFIQSQHYKIHLKLHEPDKWVQCTYNHCTKKFSNEYALKRHLRTHQKKKKFLTNDTKKTQIGSDNKVCNTERKEKQENLKIKRVINEKSNNFINANYELSIAYERLNKKKTYISTTKSAPADNKNLLSDTYKKSVTLDDLRDIDIFRNCSEDTKYKTPNIVESFKTNDEAPHIVYQKDGSIKLKETFDVDFLIGNKLVKKNYEIEDSKNILMNSCKTILGRCIVSSDGSNEDECLCAKMSARDEELTAEEIEEITPQPQLN